MHRTDKLILVGLAVTAVIAGVLSYAGLAHFADSAGLATPWLWLPWVWPLALDLPAVILSMAVWRARQVKPGPWSAWGARLGVLAFGGVSTLLQVSTASLDWAPRIGHGLPPVALLILWESVLWLQAIGQDTEHRTSSDADNVQVTPPVHVDRTADNKEDTPARRPAPPPRPRPDRAIPQTTTSPAAARAAAAVRSMVEDGEDVTYKTLAARMDCTPRNAARHLDRPEVRAILEISPVPLLDSPGMLARTGACEEAERANPALSAPDLVVSSAGGDR